MARQSFLASRNKIRETILIREKLELQEWPENRASHTKDVILIKQEVSTGELGDSSLSVGGKNENEIASHTTIEVPETFRLSRFLALMKFMLKSLAIQAGNLMVK